MKCTNCNKERISIPCPDGKEGCLVLHLKPCDCVIEDLAEYESIMKNGFIGEIEDVVPYVSNPRKEYPLFSGLIKYFPNALTEVSHVSFKGNQQHNPNEPLHWAKEKSNDHLDAALRHLTDHANGDVFDEDGVRHLSKASWRLLAQLQTELEKPVIDETVQDYINNKVRRNDLHEKMKERFIELQDHCKTCGADNPNRE